MKTFKEYCMEKENIDESLKELGGKAKRKVKEILGLFLPIDYSVLNDKQKKILSMISPDSETQVPELVATFGDTLASVVRGEHAEYKNVSDYLDALYKKAHARFPAYEPILQYL